MPAPRFTTKKQQAQYNCRARRRVRMILSDWRTVYALGGPKNNILKADITALERVLELSQLNYVR